MVFGFLIGAILGTIIGTTVGELFDITIVHGSFSISSLIAFLATGFLSGSSIAALTGSLFGMRLTLLGRITRHTDPEIPTLGVMFGAMAGIVAGELIGSVPITSSMVRDAANAGDSGFLLWLFLIAWLIIQNVTGFPLPVGLLVGVIVGFLMGLIERSGGQYLSPGTVYGVAYGGGLGLIAQFLRERLPSFVFSFFRANLQSLLVASIAGGLVAGVATAYIIDFWLFSWYISFK